MNSTETSLAAAFHASILLQLGRFNARQGRRYFERAPVPAGETYWRPATSRSGCVTELPRDTQPDTLLAAAATLWTQQGDATLASLLPDLLALRASLVASPATAGDGEVSISVYPLF